MDAFSTPKPTATARSASACAAQNAHNNTNACRHQAPVHSDDAASMLVDALALQELARGLASDVGADCSALAFDSSMAVAQHQHHEHQSSAVYLELDQGSLATHKDVLGGADLTTFDTGMGAATVRSHAPRATTSSMAAHHPQHQHQQNQHQQDQLPGGALAFAEQDRMLSLANLDDVINLLEPSQTLLRTQADTPLPAPGALTSSPQLHTTQQQDQHQRQQGMQHALPHAATSSGALPLDPLYQHQPLLHHPSALDQGGAHYARHLGQQAHPSPPDYQHMQHGRPAFSTQPVASSAASASARNQQHRMARSSNKRMLRPSEVQPALRRQGAHPPPPPGQDYKISYFRANPTTAAASSPAAAAAATAQPSAAPEARPASARQQPTQASQPLQAAASTVLSSPTSATVSPTTTQQQSTTTSASWAHAVSVDMTTMRLQQQTPASSTPSPSPADALACGYCSMVFGSNAALAAHLQTHETTDKPHLCSLCNKGFATRALLSGHMRRHRRKKSHECTICHKVLAEGRNLVTHMRTHTNERPFACDMCPKSFTTKSYLKVHKRVHTREKPYVCSVCNKGFTTSSYLKVHMRVHTLEKPYSCDQCGKTFLCSSNQVRHMKMHKRKAAIASRTQSKEQAANVVPPQGPSALALLAQSSLSAALSDSNSPEHRP
eukprot:m.15738 g.15738  ORF g.15738 m.15738 type:complete len:667 (+) comp5079_c0_seq1:552-2552(+)